MPGEMVASVDWPGTKNAASHRVWLPEAAPAILAELVNDGANSGLVMEAEANRIGALAEGRGPRSNAVASVVRIYLPPDANCLLSPACAASS
jgi:hypothetical protein